MQTALIAIVLAFTSTGAFGQYTTQNYVKGPVVVAADNEFVSAGNFPLLASITVGDIYFVAGNVSVNTNNASANSWNIWYNKLDSGTLTVTAKNTASFVAPQEIFYYNNYAVGFGTDNDSSIPQIRAYQIPLAGGAAIPRLTISTNTNATYTPTVAQTALIGGVVYIFYNAANLKVNVTNFAVGSSTVGTPEFTLSTTFDNPQSLSVAWNEALGSNQLFAVWIQNGVLLDSVLNVSQGIVGNPTTVLGYNSSYFCTSYNTNGRWYGVFCTTLTSGILSIYITKDTDYLVPLSNYSDFKFIFTVPYGPYLAIFYQNMTNNGILCYEIWNLDTITLIKAITVFWNCPSVCGFAQLAVPSKGFYTLLYNAPNDLTTSVQVGLLLGVPATPDCQTYSAAGPCQTCDSNYLLTSWAQCLPCAPFCQNCSVSGQGLCDTCSPGYILNSDSMTCEPCASNCNSCSSSGRKNCDPGMCQAGYYACGTTCCQCQSPCAACSSNNTCTTCVAGYTFDQSKGTCAMVSQGSNASGVIISIVVCLLFAGILAVVSFYRGKQVALNTFNNA
jgi:hypothetical protein